MLSYTGMQSQCQKNTADYTNDGLTFFREDINIGLTELQNALGSFYTEDTWTDTTVASQKAYQTPEDFVRLKSARVTVGSVEYPMESVYDENLWRQLQSAAVGQTSDFPTKVFVRYDTYEIYPTPSSSSNTITLIYESGGKELSAEDYITGGILTLANGGTAVTGTGTTWTSAMAGRYLKVTAEGSWYKIASFGTTTTLTLQKKYQGLAIAAGSEAYKIGQMPNTPPSTHILPVFYACWRYYEGVRKDSKQAGLFRDNLERGVVTARSLFGHRYSTKVIPSQRGIRKGIGGVNPNWYPSGMS